MDEMVKGLSIYGPLGIICAVMLLGFGVGARWVANNIILPALKAHVELVAKFQSYMETNTLIIQGLASTQRDQVALMGKIESTLQKLTGERQ